MVECADFISNSVLTVIYRAQLQPNSTTAVSSKCHLAARQSLENHLRCFAQFRDRDVMQQSEYVNWILLYPSFTPFTIVFIHAIATADTGELQLLQETVKSLDHVKALSPAARRLHDVCTAFLRVAKAFIASQRTLNGWHRRNDGSVALPHADAENDAVLPGGVDAMDEQQPQEQDALSAFMCSLAANNRPLTDFLHVDLLDIDFGFPPTL